MKKTLIFSLLILCCCGVFLLTGCKKDDTATTTATVKTPIQQLTENMSAQFQSVWANENDQNNALTNFGNRIGDIEIWKSGLVIPDYTSVTARLGVVELSNTNASADIAFIKIQITDILNRLAGVPTTNATPTPTPTPTPINCGVARPVAVSPSSGNTSVVNGTVLFEWSNCVNAHHYEFWFGSDASSMILAKNISAPVTFYTYPVPLSNTYYFWKVVSVSSCNITESDAWWFKTQ